MLIDFTYLITESPVLHTLTLHHQIKFKPTKTYNHGNNC
jgi:hypothetical protein